MLGFRVDVGMHVLGAGVLGFRIDVGMHVLGGQGCWGAPLVQLPCPTTPMQRPPIT